MTRRPLPLASSLLIVLPLAAPLAANAAALAPEESVMSSPDDASSAPTYEPAFAPAPVSAPPAATAPMSSPEGPQPEAAKAEPAPASPASPASLEPIDPPKAKASTPKKRRAKRERKPSNAANALAQHRPIQVSTGENSTLTLAGYVETFYSYNFNRPSNGLTNFRAFDNQHNSFTLQNTAIDAAWTGERVYARIALQAGHAPNTYYGASEPTRPGSDGVGTSDPTLWRNIQQAYAGARPFANAPVFIEAGIFLSPIGFEGLGIHENWHWSHSPLFFALPFYHSGLKIGADLGEAHQVKVAIYNGWNNVTDNNSEKSLSAEYAYTPSDTFALAAIYFTGVERPTDAPEGRAWRHVVNVAAKGTPIPRLGLVGNINAGFEPNLFGTSRWVAAAAGLRVEAFPWLFLAGRGSIIDEFRGDEGGVADSILLANYSDDPLQWVGSGTFTIDLRPVPDHFALKLEYRHDHARSDIFFRGTVVGDGTPENPYVANALAQNTLMLGLHAWF